MPEICGDMLGDRPRRFLCFPLAGDPMGNAPIGSPFLLGRFPKCVCYSVSVAEKVFSTLWAFQIIQIVLIKLSLKAFRCISQRVSAEIWAFPSYFPRINYDLLFQQYHLKSNSNWCYRPWKTLCGPERLYSALKDFIRPWKTLFGPERLYSALKDFIRPWKTLSGPERLYSALKDFIRPWKTLFGPERLYPALKDYSALKDFMRPWKTLFGPERLYSGLSLHEAHPELQGCLPEQDTWYRTAAEWTAHRGC